MTDCKNMKISGNKKENIENGSFELLFKIVRTWYAIYIDHNSTLKELRKNVAEKTNIEVERFSLYLISGNILLLNNDDEKTTL